MCCACVFCTVTVIGCSSQIGTNIRAPRVLCPNAWLPGRVGGITKCNHESHPKCPKIIWWEIHCIGRKENISSTMILPGGAVLVSLTQNRKVSTSHHFLDFRESTGQLIQPGWDCLSGKRVAVYRYNLQAKVFNMFGIFKCCNSCQWMKCDMFLVNCAFCSDSSCLYVCFNWAKTDNWNDYVCSRDQLIFHWTWSTCLTQIEVSHWESWRNVCEAIWWSNLDRWTSPLKGWVMCKQELGKSGYPSAQGT